AARPATALAWARAGVASSSVAVSLIGLAAATAQISPLGALAYLGPGLWVGSLAARGRLTSLGLGTAVSPGRVAAGVLVAAGLSGHLLVSASRTLGLQVRLDQALEVLVAIGYDVGANVLAGECFFRGALFRRAERRWSFAAASTVATSAYVLRYLVDPLLPKSVELMIGAVFYLALLGAINSGSSRGPEASCPGSRARRSSSRPTGRSESDEPRRGGPRGGDRADRPRRERARIAHPSRLSGARRRGRPAVRCRRWGAGRRDRRAAERAAAPAGDRTVGSHRRSGRGIGHLRGPGSGGR